MPEVGDTLGSYTLLRRLAVGGMGEVFVAAKPGPVGFGPYVALKVLRDELACDQQFVDMLVDEANISMFLNHQNVVPVIDLGTDEGAYFIAMQYVQGITVERLIESMLARNKRLSVPVGLYIGRELCRALKYAHTRVNHNGEPLNIVHRDVTPANLLLSTQGEVKLTDFGIARAKGRVHQTQAGVLKGKFGYMAPEMVRYEKIDARADLFCAGVCMYLLLSGQHPVAGAAVMEAIQRFEQKQIPPPSSLNPDINAELDALIMRCLEPQVDARWRTAAELGDALQAVMLRHPGWRAATSDGARFISDAIREVAPEAFDAPVSPEQNRDLLERALAAGADRGESDDVKVVGLVPEAAPLQDPTEPYPEGRVGHGGGILEEDDLDLPTAQSRPAITSGMDFDVTPTASEPETDEQIPLEKIREAQRLATSDLITAEQNVAKTEDVLMGFDTTDSLGVVTPSVTVPSPVVEGVKAGQPLFGGAADPAVQDSNVLEEPSLPPGHAGGALSAAAEAQDRTVAEYQIPDFDDSKPVVVDATLEPAPTQESVPAYEEGVIDRDLAPVVGDDATVVSGGEVGMGDDMTAVAPAVVTDAPSGTEATFAAVPSFSLDPVMPQAPSGEENLATVVPDNYGRPEALWQDNPADESGAETLLEGLVASDVKAVARDPSNGPSPRSDTEAMDPPGANAFGGPVPGADPKPLQGPVRISGHERPPGIIGPGATAAPPGSTPPPQLVAGVPIPAPQGSDAGLGDGSPEGIEDSSVGYSTGRWIAGEIEADALAWDDDAAARRAVATRNQGPGAPAAGVPLAPPAHASASVARPAQAGRGKNVLLMVVMALVLTTLGGLGYAFTSTKLFWARLTVMSVPSGAKVVLDGVEQSGQTPMKVWLEPDKAHRVEFQLDGYHSTSRHIAERVSWLRRYRVEAELKRLVPNVFIPVEATVFINGEVVGTGQKVALSALPPSGRVTLRVEAKGYRTYEHTFSDHAQIPVALDVPLSKE